MDTIKVEPESYEDCSVATRNEGNCICIKEEYVEQLFASENPENTHFKSVLQCKKEEKQEDMLAEEHGILIKRINLLSDNSANDIDLVDNRSKDEDTQPLPWRVCESDEQTISKDTVHMLDGTDDTYHFEMCSKQSFQRHLKAHSVFWCEDCNHEFCSQLNLQLPTETEIMPTYACKVCHVKFKTPGHLRQHGKPYSCDRCAEGSSSCDKFPQIFQQCPVCKQNFTSYDYLRAHLKHHSKDKVYLCNTCNMQCFTLTVFKNHLDTHKEEKHIAPKMYKRKSKPLKGLTVNT